MSRELGRTLSVDEVKPAAIAALGEVFGLAFETLAAPTARLGRAVGRGR